jgi:serine protease
MKRFHLFIIIPLALLALVLFSKVQSAASAPSTVGNGLPARQSEAKPEIPTNQVIIKYKESSESQAAVIPSQADELQRLNDAGGTKLEYVREMSGGAFVYRLPGRTPTEEINELTKKLMALPEIEYAEPDSIMQIMVTPNDPRYSDQWHYSAPAAGHYGINMPAAWDITTGSTSIVVADIDTGITDHPDLAGRTVPGYDFITSPLSANDGDGWDSDPHDPGDWATANLCNDGRGATDSSWHGTHTAGTIGAASNNGLGVAGINWVSKILPVRVLGRCGGTLSDIADGMRWAAGLPVSGVPANPNPAKVINMSLGGKGACGSTYQDAVNAINAAGATIVVSAGNDSVDASGFRPANCDGVVSVAATDRNGDLAYYSNKGAIVKIAAPGGAQSAANDPNGVLSTLNTGLSTPATATYIYYQGTSMAAPHVSGVASLLYSLNPTITSTQVLKVLQNTVTAFPPGSLCNTSICGPGILNAGGAVSVLPRLSKMNLSYVAQGSGPLTLIVTGTNFLPGSAINWDGSPHGTTVVNSTELTTTLTPLDLNTTGMHKISVTIHHPIYGSLKTSSLTLGVGKFIFFPILSRPAEPLVNWTNILTEDFEGAFPGSSWDLHDNSSGQTGAYLWGKRGCLPFQGSFSGWAVGGGTSGPKLTCGSNYPNNIDTWMIYGPFSLQDAKDAELRFKYWLNSGLSNDRLLWLVSLDGTQYSGYASYSDSSKWTDGLLDLKDDDNLNNLMGESQVWIAFVFQSDSSTNYPVGAYLDNITLRKCTSTAGCADSANLQPPAADGQNIVQTSMTLIK